MLRDLIIDAHQHLWTLGRGDYDWITPDLAPLARDFGPDDLSPLLVDEGVSGTVLVQAAPTDGETDFLLSVAERTPWVMAVVGWVDPIAVNTPDRLAVLSRRAKFRGVRPMLQDEPDLSWLPERPARRFFEALIDLRLRFDALVVPQQLEALIGLADAYPRLPIVINHAGNPPAESDRFLRWQMDMRNAAMRPNLSVKFSGLSTLDRNILNQVLDTLLRSFGSARLMWGSDWPVLLLASDYSSWKAETCALLSEKAGGADYENIMGRTAARFYGLE